MEHLGSLLRQRHLEPAHRPARTGRTGTPRRRKAARSIIASGVAALLAAMSLPLAALPAQAVVGAEAVGPVDNTSKVPIWFRDSHGLQLQPCFDGVPNCTVTQEEFLTSTDPDTGDPNGEAFYSLASASAGRVDLVLALETAWFPPETTPGLFQRTRITSKGGLKAGATYTITEPYGTHRLTANSSGAIVKNAGTSDVGCPAPPCGDFQSALGGPITSSSFLTWDTYGAATGAPPLGFVGDNATPHKVNSPTPSGVNYLQVDGPDVGGPGVNTVRTDLFTVLGKVVDGPVVGIDPGSIAFGNRTVGVPTSMTVTVRSKGTTPLTVGTIDPAAPTPISITGPQAGQYAVANDTCNGASVAPGSSCTLDIVYTPDAGASSATLNIPTNAGTQTVVLSGQSVPNASVAPSTTSAAPADFGAVVVGQTSTAKTFTLKNAGGAPLTLAGMSLTPSPNDFGLSASSTCAAGVVLQPAATCTAVVNFAPTSPGAAAATLSFSDDAASSPQEVFLKANATQPAVSITQAAVFPSTNVGSQSSAQTLTITNTGTADLHISDVAAGGTHAADFPESDNCFGAAATFTVAPGASCTAQVSFAPTASGARRGLLQVSDDAPGSPHVMALSGQGVAAAPTAPGAPTVGTATPGNASASVTWTPPASNGGSAITGYTVQAVTAAGAVAGSTTAASGATSATVSTGLSNGTSYQLKVAATNSVGTGSFSPLSNAVTPTAPPAARAALSPASVAFGSVAVGSTSAAQTVTLTNSGTASMTISSIAVTGANPTDFVRGTTTCGTSLAAGASCTVPVSFRPATSGAKSASLTVTDNAAGSPHSIPLTGTGGTVSTPTITARNPAPGATGVAIGTTTTRTPLSVTFSEAVTGLPTTAAATANYTLRQGTTAVASKVVYNTTTRVATLTPDAALIADRTYTLSLSSAIRSASGGALAATSWTFITGPVPTVTSSNPAINATGVALGTTTARTPLTATFSEAVTGLPTTSAATANYTLRLGTTAVASKVVYNTTTRVATLTPDAPLLADRTYTLTLTNAIKDAAGNPMATRTWNFITGPRPTVTARTPGSGATGVSRTANLTATFSEAVTGIPTTAAASSTFTIKQTSNNAAFASVVSYNSTSRVATLNPTGTLLSNTQYTVTLSSGIRDTAGNTLTALSWTFTTGAV